MPLKNTANKKKKKLQLTTQRMPTYGSNRVQSCALTKIAAKIVIKMYENQKSNVSIALRMFNCISVSAEISTFTLEVFFNDDSCWAGEGGASNVYSFISCSQNSESKQGIRFRPVYYWILFLIKLLQKNSLKFRKT